MGGYLLLAVGLINLRYQTGQADNLGKSLTLIVPGALLLAITFIDGGKKWLQTTVAAATVLTVGGILLAYSFIN
ncbi:hypothetical protein MCEMRE217_00236 [Candidatus Nanopelagicaceae bacterium]